jgi:hypothetical protein
MKRIVIPRPSPNDEEKVSTTMDFGENSYLIIDPPKGAILSLFLEAEIERNEGNGMRSYAYLMLFRPTADGKPILLINEDDDEACFKAPILRIDRREGHDRQTIHFHYKGSRGQLFLPDPGDERQLSLDHPSLPVKPGTLYAINIDDAKTTVEE